MVLLNILAHTLLVLVLYARHRQFRWAIAWNMASVAQAVLAWSVMVPRRRTGYAIVYAVTEPVIFVLFALAIAELVRSACQPYRRVGAVVRWSAVAGVVCFLLALLLGVEAEATFQARILWVFRTKRTFAAGLLGAGLFWLLVLRWCGRRPSSLLYGAVAAAGLHALAASMVGAGLLRPANFLAIAGSALIYIVTAAVLWRERDTASPALSDLSPLMARWESALESRRIFG